MKKLNHKIINKTILKEFGYNYRKEKPKNYTYFNKGDLEFFIEIIPAGKYLKTIFIKFINKEFYNGFQEGYNRIKIGNKIKELYEKQTEGQGVNYCIYSEGLFNELF